MAELLKFKHGLLSNIKTNTTAINPGTVYITRDERAMYIDLPPYEKDGIVEAAKRVRIGDLHTFEYLDEMKTAIKNDMTELTESALYYAEKNNRTENKVINALLKWNGTEFIQLNEVSEVTANLNELSSSVASLNTRVGNLETAINDENGTVATKIAVETQAREQADTKHTEDIAKNAEAIATNAGNISTNSGKIQTIEGQITAINTNLNSTIPNTYLTKSDASATYLTKTDASNTYATQTNLSDAKTELVGANNDDSSKNTIWAAKNMASAASASAVSANTLASKADTTATNNSGEIATIKGRLDTVEGVAGNAATKTELEQEVSDREAAIAGVNQTTAGLNTRLEQVEVYFEADGRGDEVINTFNEIVNYITEDKSGAEAMLSSINKNTGDIANLNTRLTVLDKEGGKIATIEGQITSLNTAVGKAERDANAYTESLLTWGTF